MPEYQQKSLTLHRINKHHTIMNDISKNDFIVQKNEHFYRVVYVNPRSGEQFYTQTTDTALIKEIFNTTNPTRTNMRILREKCKNGIRI
jgi:hypothetical protein